MGELVPTGFGALGAVVDSVGEEQSLGVSLDFMSGTKTLGGALNVVMGTTLLDNVLGLSTVAFTIEVFLLLLPTERWSVVLLVMVTVSVIRTVGSGTVSMSIIWTMLTT